MYVPETTYSDVNCLIGRCPAAAYDFSLTCENNIILN